MITWNSNCDKSAWPEGPWKHEPDGVQWVDENTNLDCLILRNYMGVLCGYVGVPEGHPLFGIGFEEVRPAVHGGLSFSGLGYTQNAPVKLELERIDENERGGEQGTDTDVGTPESEEVGPVFPDPSRPREVWWFGFDCGHSWGYAPVLSVLLPDLLLTQEQVVYRDLEFVKGQVKRLAEQLANDGAELIREALTIEDMQAALQAMMERASEEGRDAEAAP